uniref:Uncharacterized protein n=1 Tax=Erpetoichthys calabaricus TaxID=27687 RepID=A0A8C4SAB0_ERPCA
MWSPALFQLSFIKPLDMRISVRAMWPQTQFICTEMENKTARQMENLRKNMDLMNQQLLREKLDADRTHKLSGALVKQVGRKALLSGEMEKKEETEGGSYGYRYQVFRQELKLPEDVNAGGLSCALNNRQLLIEALRMTVPNITPSSGAIDDVTSGPDDVTSGSGPDDVTSCPSL